MIELPPNSRPELKPASSNVSGSVTSNASTTAESSGPNATQATTEINAAKLAQQQVKQNVEAVVLQAKLIEQSVTAEKPLYEMLLRITGQASAGSPAVTSNAALTTPNTPITQITPQVIATLQKGQALLVKVIADFPLTPSTRLLATASIDKGLQIQKADLPGLIATHNNAFKQLIPVQRSLTQLMSTLELFAKPQSENHLIQSLPTQVRSALQDLAATLPRVNQIKEPGYIRDSIHNSGTFLENKLRNVINQQTSKAPEPDSLITSLRNLTQRILESSTTTATATATAKVVGETAKPMENGFKSALGHITGTDFKIGLQRLQQALTQASANTGQEPAGNQAGPIPQNKVAPTNAGSKQPMLNLDPGKASAMEKNIEIQQTATKVKEGSVVMPELQVRNAKPHPMMRHYSQNTNVSQSAVGPTSNQVPATQEQYILPPLPGQVLIQPQARQNLNQKKNDMAQALVSVLLSQVKGALARTTLHQLASHTQQTDNSANPTLLSFELPFLHNQQIQVFQFRIEEESAAEKNQEKQLQKRWVVQMGFDIEGMGPMLCQINLAGVNASVSFWAEWENTLQHTKSHFDFLQKTLTDMGLRVDKLQGHLGIPANERTMLSNQLVDIRL